MTDSTSALATLSHRIDLLERQNRRLKIAGALVLMAGAALFLTGAGETKPAPITASRITLVDGQNRSTMNLYGDYNGNGAAIVLTKPTTAGNLQSAALVSGPVPALTLGNETAHARVSEASISMTDGAGTQNVYVSGGVMQPRVTIGAIGAQFVEIDGARVAGHNGSTTTWHQP